MYFSTFLLIPIFLHQSHLFCQAILPCPPTWIHVAQLDNCYFSAPQPDQWEYADEYCRERDSHLVSVYNQEEADIVKAIFARENPSFLNWIGLRWNETAGNFTWSDGSSLTHSEFLTNADNDDCVAWVLDENLDGWKSISCYYSQFFMCQKQAGGTKTIWHIGQDTGSIAVANYSESEHVTHIIRSHDAESKILLRFDDFVTEKNADFLTITMLKSGKLIAKLTGFLRPGYTVWAKTNEVVINFKSLNNDDNHRGFVLTYKVVSPSPIEIFEQSSGIIASNNSQPYTFHNYQVNCQPGHHVSLKVISIDLGTLDRLKLLNGDRFGEKLVKLGSCHYSKFKMKNFSLRNGNKGETFKTSKPSAFVIFETTNSDNEWKLEYECVDDGNLGSEIEI